MCECWWIEAPNEHCGHQFIVKKKSTLSGQIHSDAMQVHMYNSKSFSFILKTIMCKFCWLTFWVWPATMNHTTKLCPLFVTVKIKTCVTWMGSVVILITTKAEKKTFMVKEMLQALCGTSLCDTTLSNGYWVQADSCSAINDFTLSYCQSLLA